MTIGRGGFLPLRSAATGADCPPTVHNHIFAQASSFLMLVIGVVFGAGMTGMANSSEQTDLTDSNTSFVESSVGRIALRDTRGDGQPVLFIHGNSSCLDVFEQQFDAPELQAYRLMALDLPGHGRSADAEDPDAVYNVSAYAALAREILDRSGAHRPLVVGWSLGGHIGIEMIGQGAELAGLAISGTPPCNPGLKQIAAAFTPLPHMAFTCQEVFSEVEALTYTRYTCGLGMPVDERLLNAVKRTDGRARRIMWDNLAVHGRGLPQADIIGSSEIPVAVIQGVDEPFFDNGYLDRLTWRNRWRGRTLMVPGAGHAPFRENPTVYNRYLADFLADVTA